MHQLGRFMKISDAAERTRHTLVRLLDGFELINFLVIAEYQKCMHTKTDANIHV